MSAESQPRLAALIADAAAEPPDEVYVSLALEAGVLRARRGRRVLLLGLPLFGLLSEPDLRAVVADDAAAQRRLQAHAPAWDAYWIERLLVALEAGRRPPLLDGLAAYLRDAPFEGPGDAPPAAELLEEVPQLEQEVLAARWKRPLEPMAWSEFGDVYLVRARRNVADFGFVVAGLTAGELGEAATNLELLADQVRRRVSGVPLELMPEIAATTLADGLAVALADAGWEVTSDIGKPLLCRQGDREIDPIEEVMSLAEGTRGAAGWMLRASELGIAGLSLEPRS